MPNGTDFEFMIAVSVGLSRFPRGPAPVVSFKQSLAEADGSGGDLHQLIFLDIFERRFERQLSCGADLWRPHPCWLCAYLSSCFALVRVDRNIVILDMFADDLAFIDLLAGLYEEKSSVIKSHRVHTP